MSYKSTKLSQNKKQKKRAACVSLSGDRLLSLGGFRSSDIPDVTPLKLVYSDYRVLTAVANQAEYVYRANSVFDPDQSGVGGQPDGFDQWKALYGVYRVVAVGVEVEAIGNGANTNGLVAVAPSDTAGGFASAEELAGLRYGKAAAFSQTSNGRVRLLVHIAQLAGRNDDSVLADPNFGAVVTTNPTSQFYIVVGIETGNSATGQTMVWTKLTYYTRMEDPIATLDSAALHRARVSAGLPPALRSVSAEVTKPETRIPSDLLPTTLALAGATVVSAAAPPVQLAVPERLSAAHAVGLESRASVKPTGAHPAVKDPSVRCLAACPTVCHCSHCATVASHGDAGPQLGAW